MDLRRVFDEVDRLHPDAVQRLAALVAIPSVGDRPDALDAAVTAVATEAQEAGLEVETWPSPAEGGARVLHGHRPAPPGVPTLLFYGHYDVQPADPVEAWHSPPFEPTIRDGALYGRGAGDNKGQLLAHLTALRALDAAGGCPVGVQLLVEGEEEIGSPHLARVVESRAASLACDAALTADGPVHDDGRFVLLFGVRGLLCLELQARGASRDLHSGNRGGLAPTPAWTLVEALSRLRDAAGRITLPGFHDTVRPPDEADLRLLDALPFDRQGMLADMGIDGFPPWVGERPLESLMFRPHLNIAGLSGGYTGPGVKTVLPCRATARLDFRLVPDQDPDAVEEAVRRRLEDLPVEVHRMAAVPPSGTPVDNPFTAPVVRALEAAGGTPPWLRPRLAGTTPDFVFTRLLGVPSLLIPYGPPDMNHHAPDERMNLESLRRGARATAAICVEVARQAASPEPQ